MIHESLHNELGRTLRGLREAKRLSLRALAREARVSPSFLSDVEAGKKGLRLETIRRIAQALECPTRALTDPDDSAELGQLERTSAVDQIPYRELGVSAARLVITPGIMSRRSRDVSAQHLFRAAVRWQLEKEVWEEKIETAAQHFRSSMNMESSTWHDYLQRSLHDRGILLGELDLERCPTLRQDRTVLVGRPPRLLLVNPLLSPEQRLFVLAREIGYIELGIDDRSRVYPPDQEHSFDQVLNDYHASYFGAATLVPPEPLLSQLLAVLQSEQWSSAAFERLLNSYRGIATAETVMYRFSQVMRRLDLRTHFLKVSSDDGTTFQIEKRLNLSSDRASIGSSEHLCLRWLSTRTITELRRNSLSRVVDAQVSKFPNPEEAYVGICVAQAADDHRTAVSSERVSTSLTVGFRITSRTKEFVRFLRDPRLRRREVGGCCERCPLDCIERVVRPSQLERANELRALLELD